ncbi:cAMP-dependent protein kinase subunit [Borealophlyctis nickersoniae]|nr:cAMP-dependent protein kinase subunit [Borealophlyctis nickersoniae]
MILFPVRRNALVKHVRYIPDHIRGDLDSLRPEVGEWYADHGTTVTRVDDQDTTDFQKCLAIIEEVEAGRGEKHEIIVLGALSGRFDHTMASIHTLFLVPEPRMMYLVSGESIAFLLRPGLHRIECYRSLEGPTCGLIPIGVSVAKVVTKGLKWDVDKSMPLSFGKLVSTSNAFADGIGDVAVVGIETDAPVIWTAEGQLFGPVHLFRWYEGTD